LVQDVPASAQAFCHCSANFSQTCRGFIAACWKSSAPVGQLPIGPKLGSFSFDRIADGEACEFGNLICCSQAFIMRSIVWICILVMFLHLRLGDLERFAPAILAPMQPSQSSL
jgi:hypothetical protein